MSMYKTILGESWEGMDPELKKLHSGSPSIRALCMLRIANGANPPAWFLARILGLPGADPSATVTLTIRPQPFGEVWERSFPDCRLTTLQSVSAEGHLVESYGMVVLWFRLVARDGGIDLRLVRTFFRFGTALFRLPDRLAPGILAREEPSADAKSIRVMVEITLPCVGQLLKYEGTVRVQD